jgi:cell fate (sporulation/competence/biofilm development) regulator YlbF (YheA/YmcA/DUF963 family)
MMMKRKKITPVPANVRHSADTLVESLVSTEVIQVYQQTYNRYTSDPEAASLIERFNQAQEEARIMQANGGLTSEKIEGLRKMQAEVQGHPSIMQFILARQAAVQFLREINAEISQELNIDFASLARRTCGS